MSNQDRVVIITFALFAILALVVFPTLYQAGYVFLFGDMPSRFVDLALFATCCCLIVGFAAFLWVRAARRR